MNVEELILKLKKFNPETQVLMANDEGGGFDDIIEVKALSVKKRDKEQEFQADYQDCVITDKRAFIAVTIQ